MSTTELHVGHVDKFPGLLIWHKAEGTPYHVENSYRGLEHVAQLRGDWWPADGVLLAPDIDLLPSKGGTAMATHWRRPLINGFRDPRGELDRLVRTDQLTVRELQRLEAPMPGVKPFKIQTLHGMMARAVKLGLGICGEAKDAPASESLEYWQRIKHDADRTGCHFVAMTEQARGASGAAWRRLDAAHRAGVPTLLLHRADVDWHKWAPILDGIKGYEGHINRRPASVARLGMETKSATRYGSSCGDQNVRSVALRVAAL